MPFYDVPFTITGSVRGVWAESPDEAKAKVDDKYSEAQLADKYGLLETHKGENPRTVGEYRRQMEIEALFKEASLG